MGERTQIHGGIVGKDLLTQQRETEIKLRLRQSRAQQSEIAEVKRAVRAADLTELYALQLRQIGKCLSRCLCVGMGERGEIC